VVDELERIAIAVRSAGALTVVNGITIEVEEIIRLTADRVISKIDAIN
jgi:hypothetical protein